MLGVILGAILGILVHIVFQLHLIEKRIKESNKILSDFLYHYHNYESKK